MGVIEVTTNYTQVFTSLGISFPSNGPFGSGATKLFMSTSRNNVGLGDVGVLPTCVSASSLEALSYGPFPQCEM